MLVGKIYCPDIDGEQSPYWFNMYINLKCCKYSQVLPVIHFEPDGSVSPGMIGKVIFRSRCYIPPEIDIACSKMSDTYNAAFATTGDHSQWFKDQILVL